MKRNSKIFIGLSIFLFFCAFSFKFTIGNGSSFELVWGDMLTLMMALLASAIAMVILVQKAKKEDLVEEDELELKEFSKRTVHKFDSDEFV